MAHCRPVYSVFISPMFFNSSLVILSRYLCYYYVCIKFIQIWQLLLLANFSFQNIEATREIFTDATIFVKACSALQPCLLCITYGLKLNCETLLLLLFHCEHMNSV